MTRRKILVRITTAVGILVALLIVVLLLAPVFVDLGPVRSRVLDAMSKNLEGEVRAGEINLSLIPRPVLEIRRVELPPDAAIQGKVRNVKAVPKVYPLLTGRIRLAKVVLEGPDLSLTLPGLKEADRAPGIGISPEKFRRAAERLLSRARSRVPGLNLKVEDGNLRLITTNSTSFTFQDLDADVSFPPGDLEIELTSHSNLWNRLSLEASLQPEDLKASGRIEFRSFRPHMLTALLPGADRPGFLGSEINLDLDFRTEAFRTFSAEVNGSFPVLAFKGEEDLVIRGDRLRGTLRIEPGHAVFSIAEFDLQYPAMQASGVLTVTEKEPPITLELRGKKVDLSAGRRTALFFAGKYPSVRNLFQIMRSGVLTDLEFQSSGDSLDVLFKPERLNMTGDMTQGEIFIPPADMLLTDVTGESITISEGILAGQNLQGRWGDSTMRQAEIRFDLVGEDKPFSLSTQVQADLSQIPPLLSKVVEDPLARKHLDQIKEVQGQAKGGFSLRQIEKKTEVALSLTGFQLEARYVPVPFPLEAQGEGLVYLEDRIQVRGLEGKAGESTFSQVSGGFNWGETPGIDLASASMDISLDQVYPLVRKRVGEDKFPEELKDLKGALALNISRMKGPPGNLAELDLQANGEIKGVIAKVTEVPGEVRLRSGTFKMDPKTISFEGVDALLMDTSLLSSGSITGYQSGLKEINLVLEGEMGEKTEAWAWEKVDIPAEFRINPPITLSPARIAWNREKGLSLSADFSLKTGPEVSLDLNSGQGTFSIPRLVVQDREKSATLAFSSEDGGFSFGFSGEIVQETIDRLFVKSIFSPGRIKGNLEGRVLTSAPAESEVTGSIEASGIMLPWGPERGIEIRDLHVQAAGKKVTVESTVSPWEDNRIELGGEIRISQQDFFIDMVLSGQRLKMEEIMGMFAHEERMKAAGSAEGLKIPVKGTVDFNVEYFEYRGYQWNPVRGVMNLSPGPVLQVEIREATLCGISTPGRIGVQSEGIQVIASPGAENKDLASTLYCLAGEKDVATGAYDLQWNVFGKGEASNLVKNLEGAGTLKIGEGRIFRFDLLAKILALVNVTEIFRGKVPDISAEGIGFNSITSTGSLENGKIRLEEFILDGTSMEIVAKGDINLMDSSLDLVVLVAPFKTADAILEKIPLVGEIFGRNLITLPVQVSGNMADPTVIPLSPSAVGSELTDMMGRILKLPFKLIPFS